MSAPSSSNQPDGGAPTEGTRVSGLQSILAAGAAITGVVAAANPNNAIVRALSNAIPVFGGTLPSLVAAIGSIVAAFSRPPRLVAGR